jgi:hypothetical protein
MGVSIKAAGNGSETSWVSRFHVQAERFRVTAIENAER